MNIQNLYLQLIKDIANELVINEQYDLLDLIRDRMVSIVEMEDAYMDNQLNILENQSPEC
jgi:hypothetical protein